MALRGHGCLARCQSLPCVPGARGCCPPCGTSNVLAWNVIDQTEPAALEYRPFLEAQAAELGAATNTSSPMVATSRFRQLSARRSLDSRVGPQKDIEAYLNLVRCAGSAKSTAVRDGLSAINSCTGLAFEEGWRTDNPAIQIAGPVKINACPKILSEHEVETCCLTRRINSGRKHI